MGSYNFCHISETNNNTLPSDFVVLPPLLAEWYANHIRPLPTSWPVIADPSARLRSRGLFVHETFPLVEKRSPGRSDPSSHPHSHAVIFPPQIPIPPPSFELAVACPTPRARTHRTQSGNLTAEQENELRKTFDDHDEDGSGAIDITEFERIAIDLGEPLSSEEPYHNTVGTVPVVLL